MDIVIRNGTVVTAAGAFYGDVGIVGERITAILRKSRDSVVTALHGTSELDASGCFVLPGGIDPHVHLQMPTRETISSDDFTSGTIAAALGGTTTVIDFVEPTDGEPLLDALASRRAEADGRVAVDYGLHMTIPAWHAARPSTLATLPEVVSDGLPSFKLYLAYEGLRLDDAQLFGVMTALQEVGGLPIVHCENGLICERLRAEAVARGNTSPIYHALTRPPRQEAEAVCRVIDIAALGGSPVYILHVSCHESLSRIQLARARGEMVYAETCPQYLLLSQKALERRRGERLVCSPPLRTKEDNEALWRGLASGALDVLATDHCPFTAAEKRGRPSADADFTTIPGGLPSIEARLGLAHFFGQSHGLTAERCVEVCCTGPARIFGMRHKGKIEPGYDADLVIFEPDRWVTLQAGNTLHERVDWSPYEGMAVQGWPRDVLRGRVIVREGEFVGEPGWGRFVARQL